MVMNRSRLERHCRKHGKETPSSKSTRKSVGRGAELRWWITTTPNNSCRRPISRIPKIRNTSKVFFTWFYLPTKTTKWRNDESLFHLCYKNYFTEKPVRYLRTEKINKPGARVSPAFTKGDQRRTPNWINIPDCIGTWQKRTRVPTKKPMVNKSSSRRAGSHSPDDSPHRRHNFPMGRSHFCRYFRNFLQNFLTIRDLTMHRTTICTVKRWT